jgi:mRNA interferase ChpB
MVSLGLVEPNSRQLYCNITLTGSNDDSRCAASKSRRIGDARNSQGHAGRTRSCSGSIRRPLYQGWATRCRSEKAPTLFSRRAVGAVQALGTAITTGSRLAGRCAGRPRADLMERGEIYLVSLDPTAGHEQRGRRPVLVISPGRFNRLTGVPVVLPITTGGGFARTAGFAVSLSGAGTRTTGVVRCDQPRALDLRARGARKVDAIPDEIINEVLSRVSPLFE